MGFFISCSKSPSPEAEKLTEVGFDLYLEEKYSEALPILEQASSLGSGDADCHLGIMHELGRGVPKDFGRAFECFKQSAERGSSGGQYRLGRCYQEGIGTLVDKKKALFWHRKAAEQDNRLSPYAIDELTAEGIK